MCKWIKESNRLKHLFAGALITLAVFLGSEFLIRFASPNIASAIIALGCVFIAMFTVEYIQTLFKCKWDWLDILAGCLVPLLLLIVVIIFSVV